MINDIQKHYYTNFIGTFFPNSSDEIHLLVGMIMNYPESAIGHCYIFSGTTGSGKTTMMNILRKVFEDNSDVVFLEDMNPQKTYFRRELEKYSEKIVFATTNFAPIESNDKHKVFETGGFRIPRRIYNIWLHDILNNIDGYRDVCDSYYQKFMKAEEIRSNL